MTREAELWLGPERTSAREARRFVRRILAAWRLPPELADNAEVCTSELVANASLHARTDVYVRVLLSGPLMRVEVRDEAPGYLPVRLGRSAPMGPPGGGGREPLPSSTGRGLLIVDGLADAWGVTNDGRGKTAWFELKTHLDHDQRSSVQSVGPAPGTRRIRLIDLPARLVLSLDAHLQELLRDAELAGVGDATSAVGSLAARIRALLDRDVPTQGALWHEARQAAERGAPRVTVQLDVPTSIVSDAPVLLRLLDEADALCASGVLLTLPAGPELVAFRTWLVRTEVDLVAGAADTASCPFPD